MEKVWIITFDEVEDFISVSKTPYVFRNEADARKKLQEIKDEIKEEYAEGIKDEAVAYDEGENWAEVYGDSWIQAHYAIRLVCVNLR